VIRESRIARVVRKVKIGELKSDAAYWRTLPPLKRLAALEEIRREYHRWKYGGEPESNYSSHSREWISSIVMLSGFE
jgi:hypothetical protein